MPVTLGELSTLKSPLSVVRICAVTCCCLTFSLVASMDNNGRLSENSINDTFTCTTVWIFCMFTWCLFFILTFLIILINFIQFHNLLPISWKNLTATISALAALMSLAALLSFCWLVAQDTVKPRETTAVVSSSLTFLAYVVELHLIRTQSGEQRGYMATVPGLLKVLQVFAGCVALLLSSLQSYHGIVWWIGVSAGVYSLCLLLSLGTVVVMLGDCAGCCLVPFDRLLVGCSLLGVLVYMMASTICLTKALNLLNENAVQYAEIYPSVITETVITFVSLIAYTMDLAFSVKLLCDRN